MKKFLALIGAFLLLISLSAWRTGRRPAEELKKLGIAPSMGKMTLRIDSRSGASQKGYLKSVIEVPEALEEKISGTKGWNPLPLDEDFARLLQTDLKEAGRFFPKISSGYYMVIDRSKGKTKEEGKHDLIAALYDTGRNTIYYCEVKQ